MDQLEHWKEVAEEVANLVRPPKWQGATMACLSQLDWSSTHPTVSHCQPDTELGLPNQRTLQNVTSGHTALTECHCQEKEFCVPKH